MAKNIFEELPARKHAPAKAAPAAAKGGDDKGGREGGDGSEKRIRQAVYDIRYRARREGIDLRAAYSQYMQNSNLSAQEQAAVRAKLFGKDGGGAKEVKEERTAADPGMKGRMGKDGKYNNPYSGGPKKELIDKKIKIRMAADASRAASEPKKNRRGRELPEDTYDALMTKGATNSVANALFQVFVEKTPDAGYEDQFAEDANSERKYKVRVTDPKSEKSYVRYADRAKITELRQKGLKVEMTEHGDPYEGERKKKGGMDPVAKNPKDRDGDVNNDGKKDGTDKYIYNRRDAINAAIAKKKGEVKEDFLIDGTTSTEGQNKGKITGTNVDNSKLITVNPENTADAHGMNKRRGIYAHTETEITASRKRLFEMIAEKKKADACSHNGKGEECGVHGMKACPDTEVNEEKEEKKEDTRANKTYRDLLKNKMRSAGMNVFAACGDEDKLEDSAMKAMTAAFVRPGEDGKMKMVSLYDKGDSSKMKKEDYERSPEANDAKQEVAKKEAQKKREAAAKPKSDIEREGAAQREVERKGKARMGAALRRNPDLFKGL
jgi:hypothetical protein